MAKKIEVDIDYLRSIGLSQRQISDIIKNSDPDHWINSLPQGDDYYELLPCITTPDEKANRKSFIPYLRNQSDPLFSFFNIESAEFIQNKCHLLIEMSNFSFAVNKGWLPDWSNKEEKKYGIVLQNGQAKVSENEFFNLYVFGIVTKTRGLALEMLEEYKERIETYFNICYFYETEKQTNKDVQNNPLFEKDLKENLFVHTSEKIQIPNIDFIGSFAPKYENVSLRKKRKALIETDIPKIKDMIANNVPQKEIAEIFNYSQGTISRIKNKSDFDSKEINSPSED